MATFYCKYDTGSNTNNGLTWDTAWKDLNGATAALIAPGDIIKTAKSPDPTLIGDCKWNDLSRVVTNDSIDVNLCETAWTPSANVTCTTSTTKIQGTRSASQAIAAAFTTGLVAYQNLPTPVDLTAKTHLSFWIQVNVAVPANTLQVLLDDSPGCGSPLESLTIAEPLAAGYWYCFSIPLVSPGSLGAVVSVGLNALLDPGTVTVLIDNIVGCNPVATLIASGYVAWTSAQGANVVCGISGTAKVGVSASVGPTAAATSGLLAYHNLSAALNLTERTHVTFWIRASVAVPADQLSLLLDNDPNCPTPLETLVVNVPLCANVWQPVTVALANPAALDNVVSVGISSAVAPGAVTILLNNISGVNEISLHTAVSKNPAAWGGAEPWLMLSGIIGGCLLLTGARGHSGTSGAVATYRRACWATPPSPPDHKAQSISDSGTLGNPITFSFGWNPTTDTQDGDSFFDGQDQQAYGLYSLSRSYIEIDRGSFVRYYFGVGMSYLSHSNLILGHHSSSIYGTNLYYCVNISFHAFTICCMSESGYVAQTFSQNHRVTVGACWGNGSAGFVFFDYAWNIAISTPDCSNNQQGMALNRASQVTLIQFIASKNDMDIYVGYSVAADFHSPSLSSPTQVSLSQGSRCGIHNILPAGNHRTWTWDYTLSSDTLIFRTAAPSLRITPKTALRFSRASIARIPVNAESTSIRLWLRKSTTADGGAYNGAQPIMRVLGAGASFAQEVSVTMSAGLGVWEELTLNITPTIRGFVDVSVECNGTVGWVNIDDATIVRATSIVSTDQLDYWEYGVPVLVGQIGVPPAVIVPTFGGQFSRRLT